MVVDRQLVLVSTPVKRVVCCGGAVSCRPLAYLCAPRVHYGILEDLHNVLVVVDKVVRRIGQHIEVEGRCDLGGRHALCTRARARMGSRTAGRRRSRGGA